MSTDRRRDLDRQTAEALLAGRTRIPAGQDRLVDLLALAGAAGGPQELTGGPAALAAFRDVQRQRAAGAQPLPRTRRTVRAMLTLKVIIAFTAVTASGVALAAGTGMLPRPFGPGPVAPPAVRTSPATPPSAAASRPPSASPAPSASVSVSAAGQCRTYLKLPPDQRGKSLDSKAFAALRTAAGTGDVTAYCTALVRSPEHKPTSHPTAGPGNRPSKTPHAAPSHKTG